MDDGRWRELARQQDGVLARRQLRQLGVTEATIRNHLRVGRWAERTSTVLTTTTGVLTWRQRLWAAVLHAGPGAMVGGLSAAAVHGLRHWDRDDITVLVDNPLSFEPVDGVCFFRTRRPRADWVAAGLLPVAKVEPAILLFAGYEANARTAHGAVAAVVQQRLTTPDRLARWLSTMRCLRRSRDIKLLLGDLGAGAQSVSEIDVRRACREFGLVPPRRQTRRRDRTGRIRFTDCEWELPDGRILVLEVDGAFHLEFMQYTDDVRRQRALTTPSRIVIRCTAYELRYEPDLVMEDLQALGVRRLAS